MTLAATALVRVWTARAAPLFFGAFLAGCAGLFPSPITPSKGTSEPGPRRDFLPIAELLWSRGTEPLVHLSRDGTVRDRDSVLGTLRADGTFTTPDGDQPLVMEPDGTIHVADGYDIVIGKNGTATSKVHGQPDEVTTLEQLKEPQNNRPALTLSGGSPELARTSMWLLLIPDLLRILAKAEET